MELLRTYTLIDGATATHYLNEHWSKHMISLPKFGFQIQRVWIGNAPDTENQVIALISFPDNANLDEMIERYMNSSDFNEEMAGFDRSNITNVETKIIKSANFVLNKMP